MNLLKRIICAIKGHTEWRGMGWLGGLSMTYETAVKQQCKRCGIVLYKIVPKWYSKAIYEDITWLPEVNPDKHDLTTNYDEAHGKLKATCQIDFLAKIHETTVDELKKIGYS